MARPQDAFDWQGRLESEGRVTFGPGRWFSWVLFVVAIVGLVGFAIAIVSDGPALWSVFGFLVLAACLLTTGRAAIQGAAELTVTHDGFGMGGRAVIPFDRLAAVGTSRRNLTVYYAPLPGESLVGRQRSTGQKMLVVTLSRLGPVNPDDLAVWLLKLKGGPSAEVDSEARAGISRVFRLRE